MHIFVVFSFKINYIENINYSGLFLLLYLFIVFIVSTNNIIIKIYRGKIVSNILPRFFFKSS